MAKLVEPQGRVIGVDSSEVMIAAARKRSPAPPLYEVIAKVWVITKQNHCQKACPGLYLP